METNASVITSKAANDYHFKTGQRALVRGKAEDLEKCLMRVFPVKRNVFANEDSELCAATKYAKQMCERCDQCMSYAIFLCII